MELLGTGFNVNAYDDEEAVKTTLVEGKVSVQKGNATVQLTPGQQAQTTNDGGLKLEKNADVEEAVAWKNGRFEFNGADIKAVMRQVTRWYDVDVRFAGNLQAAHITGDMPRTLNLSQIITVLETSGIDVKVNGRTLTVTPKP